MAEVHTVPAEQAQPAASIAPTTASLAQMALNNPEQGVATGSSPDLNRTLEAGAATGLEVAGVQMMINAAGKSASEAGTQSHADLKNTVQELALQGLADASKDSVREVPAAKSELFKHWRQMIQGLAAVYTAAQPYLTQEERKHWEPSIKEQETFALTHADFGDVKKIEEAFIGEADKTSLKVAEERFANISIALARLPEHPAAAATFLNRQIKPWEMVHEATCSPEEAKDVADKFTAKEWVQNITLNKSGMNTDLDVKNALQSPDPRLAIQARADGPALLAEVDALAAAAQVVQEKIRTASGETTSPFSYEAEQKENKGKTPQELECKQLAETLICGLKLAEPEAKATGQQLKDAAAFLSGLPVEELAPFIRSTNKEQGHGGHFFFFGGSTPTLNEPEQFVKLVQQASPEKWAGVKAESVRVQNELRTEFLSLADRGTKAVHDLLKNHTGTAHIFQHGISLEELPKAMHARLEDYVKQPDNAGLTPQFDKERIEKLTKLVTEWEKAATGDQHARDAWVEEKGFVFLPNTRRLAKQLQDAFVNASADGWDMNPSSLFNNRLTRILSRGDEPKHNNDPNYEGMNSDFDSTLFSDAFHHFGKNNAEREAKLDFLMALKPHELDAVMDAIGFGVNDGPAVHIANRAAKLAELATPEGFAKLNVHEGPKHEKPEHHEKAGHPEKPEHHEAGHEPKLHHDKAHPEAGHPGASIDPTGSASAAEHTKTNNHQTADVALNAAAHSSEAGGEPAKHTDRVAAEGKQAITSYADMVGQKAPTQTLGTNPMEIAAAQTGKGFEQTV